MEIVPYFMQYQVPVGLCTIGALAIAHFFVQKHLDVKNPDEMAGKDVSAAVTAEQAKAQETPAVPSFYALLPMLPLLLVLFFGLNEHTGIKMDISLATLISISILLQTGLLMKVRVMS